MHLVGVYPCAKGINYLNRKSSTRQTYLAAVWSDLNQDYGSANAVDGKYDNRAAFRGLCTISADGKYTAEWRVDLGRVVSIFYIKIFYRRENMGKNEMKNESPHTSFIN